MDEMKVRLKCLGILGFFLLTWAGAIRIGIVINDHMLGVGINKLSRPLRIVSLHKTYGRVTRQTDGFIGPVGYITGKRVIVEM